MTTKSSIPFRHSRKSMEEKIIICCKYIKSLEKLGGWKYIQCPAKWPLYSAVIDWSENSSLSSGNDRNVKSELRSFNMTSEPSTQHHVVVFHKLGRLMSQCYQLWRVERKRGLKRVLKQNFKLSQLLNQSMSHCWTSM